MAHVRIALHGRLGYVRTEAVDAVVIRHVSPFPESPRSWNVLIYIGDVGYLHSVHTTEESARATCATLATCLGQVDHSL